jgi:hypothetical protein
MITGGPGPEREQRQNVGVSAVPFSRAQEPTLARARAHSRARKSRLSLSQTGSWHSVLQGEMASEPGALQEARARCSGLPFLMLSLSLSLSLPLWMQYRRRLTCRQKAMCGSPGSRHRHGPSSGRGSGRGSGPYRMSLSHRGTPCATEVGHFACGTGGLLWESDCDLASVFTLGE